MEVTVHYVICLTKERMGEGLLSVVKLSDYSTKRAASLADCAAQQITTCGLKIPDHLQGNQNNLIMIVLWDTDLEQKGFHLVLHQNHLGPAL